MAKYRSRIIFLSALLLMSVVAYLTYDIRGSYAFALSYRAEKLAGLLVVALSVSSSTLLFHTITGNRILTPSIMGFDSLYVMILSLIVFLFGVEGYLGLSDVVLFTINTALLVLLSFALLSTLLASDQSDIMRLVLTGIIAGVMFRSLSSLVQRMIDPSEYSVIADSSFARFSILNSDLLWVALPICVAGLAAAWIMRHKLDVLALGSEIATNLGEDPKKGALVVLALIAVLVSTSTALVGPIAFLGLLVVNLAYFITPIPQHGVLFISSGLISATALIGGQTIMERVFHFTTPLSVIIDLFGGVVFLVLVFKQVRR